MGDRNKLSAVSPHFRTDPLQVAEALLWTHRMQRRFRGAPALTAWITAGWQGVALPGPGGYFRETGDPHDGRPRLSSQSSGGGGGLTAPESSACTQSSWISPSAALPFRAWPAALFRGQDPASSQAKVGEGWCLPVRPAWNSPRIYWAKEDNQK